MHRFEKKNKVGRLLALVNRETPNKNFSFFFPVEGMEQLAELREVTKGMQEVARVYEEEYEFRTFSVADIARVGDDFPGVDEEQIWQTAIESWVDDDKRFAQDLASQVIEWRRHHSTDDLPGLVMGAITKGKDFFNQEEIISRIWELVHNGQDLLLAAPRRFGKSSLLDQLSDHTPEGVATCSVDLEKGASASDFIRLILRGLMDREECWECLPPAVRDQLDANTCERTKVAAVRRESREIEQNWRGVGAELFQKMNATKGRFLLMLDEFSWLLEDMIARKGTETQEVTDFLEWFSGICQKHKNLSVIITGSEHLEAFLEANKLSSDLIAHLERVPLAPLRETTAKIFSFLVLFKQGIMVSPADLKAIIGLMGRPIPYFLQVFLDLLQKECHRTGQLSTDDFEKIYSEELLGRDAKRYFEYIDHQVERYAGYGLHTDGIKKILNRLGQETQVEIRELSALWDSSITGTFQFLMALLKNDFFLVEHNDHVTMECKILRDYFSLQSV
ncbi:MAG: hypothetical protein JRL30_01855 [Deltaproteobacteria bacterium]|nr:hypothetical protein [Deltaproteobacteria bacterium]